MARGREQLATAEIRSPEDALARLRDPGALERFSVLGGESPLVVDLRDGFALQDRIRIIASGKLINPTEVAWALCMGTDFINSARGFMFALGCIQAMKCNKNTCPTGITTHDKKLQRGLNSKNKAVRVANYIKNMKSKR